MRSSVSRFVLALGVLAAATAAGATVKAAHESPSLTLYEKADFAGRHVTVHAAAEGALKAFAAHSAKSTGLWTLCEGRDPASKCQTVNGDAPKLKIQPVIARPGVDAVALYEQPDLKGRRVIYSFASDTPPPFAARSARTWGGAWSLCDPSTGRCQVVDGERPSTVDVQVGSVKPGRSESHLLMVQVAPPAEPAPAADTPSPQAIAEAAPPPPAAEPPPPPAGMPPPVLAEASPPPAAEPPQSPYVEIPLPPRGRSAPREEAAPEPPPAEPVVSIPVRPRPQPVAGVRRVAYDCEDGQGLTVLFDDRDQTAMILARGQDPVALRRSEREAGSGGFFYEGGGHVLFGAGSRAGYASDGAEPVDCYSRGARRQLSYRDEQPRPPAYRGEAQSDLDDEDSPDAEPQDPR